jgi:hypothetical protein
MRKNELILAALAAAKQSLTPVQVQKLFFLLDRRLADDLGGPHFHFEPYDYGPFDAGVYQALEGLQKRGLVQITRREAEGYRTYGLTQAGRQDGETILSGLSSSAATSLRALAEFVAGRSFADLVSAIYQAYPEMRARSVFRSQ